MQEGLSILIPVYNHICVNMAKRLEELCSNIQGLDYEIIVADDGSNDEHTMEANAEIDNIPNCRLCRRQINKGSAATRNFLADESRYNWLLFLDSDVDIPSDNFIAKYMENRELGVVINGGIKIGGCSQKLRNNLRFLYEKKEEHAHSAEERCRAPYKSFRSINFMVPRDVFLSCKFDERLKRFEDVYFGKVLQTKGIGIKHINNPVMISDFESNEAYIKKIELDMQILNEYKRELQGFSRMLSFTDKLQRAFPLSLVKVWHSLFGSIERKLLVGNMPNLTIFNMYRMGYFISNNK